jgi:hypothetical protein
MGASAILFGGIGRAAGLLFLALLAAYTVTCVPWIAEGAIEEKAIGAWKGAPSPR